MNEIAHRSGLALIAQLEQAGAVTPNSFDLDYTDHLSLERYEALLVLVGQVHGASKWWIGDLLLFGENAFGELASQASEALNLSPEGRQDCIRVARVFPPSRRAPNLSWWHHRRLAVRWLESEQQDALLERAERERLSTRELEALVRDLRRLDSDSRGATEEPPLDVPAVINAARAVVTAARCGSDENTCLVPREPLQALRLLLEASR
jgi:hypothetical protein